MTTRIRRWVLKAILIKRPFTSRVSGYTLALMLSFGAIVSHAMFVQPTLAPTDRLIRHANTELQKNPFNHKAYYALGRVHYLAFINKVDLVPILNHTQQPQVAPTWLTDDSVNFMMELEYESRRRALIDVGYPSIRSLYAKGVPKDLQQKFHAERKKKFDSLNEDGWRPPAIETAAVLEHANLAVVNFKQALIIQPDRALYHLGLASLYEQITDFTTASGLVTIPVEFADVSLQTAMDEYFEAYRFAEKGEVKRQTRPIEGLKGLVGHEAGNAYIRLANDSITQSDLVARRVARIEEHLLRLGDLRIGGITPIIFSLDENATYADLLAPNYHVQFDLDGNGSTEAWPWVKPSTGILVWDPLFSGKITSGRQLFGSVTWWLLFHDGYSALAMLDDDDDGWLSGAELIGVAVWFDRNQDGISSRKEVEPVINAGIQAIATNGTTLVGGVLNNPEGIVLEDGSVLPTFDWNVSPISGASVLPSATDS